MERNMQLLTQEINQFINEELLSSKGISNEVIAPEMQKQKFLDRIFLRRYRKYATTETVREFVGKRLDKIIDNKLPIVFVPSFGGYKHWWSPTYPTTDWAEIFNIKFLLEYLAPIYNSYKENSVSIVYESEEVILAELNNIPQEGLDEYTKTFREILKVFQGIVGAIPQLSLVLAREQYAEVGFTKNKLLDRIEEMMPEYYERFDSYPEDDKRRRIEKVKTNFKLDGVKDYTKCSKEQIYELYRWSRVFNEAFLDADYEVRGDSFFEDPSTIPLLFSFGLGPGGDNWPHIGSSASSMVDFWAGMGILERRDNGRIVPRIISRTQYDILQEELSHVQVHSTLSGIDKNYEYIYVYNGTLVF